jgi:hypothetical protein
MQTFSPENVRPLPKAAPKKPTKNNRRKRHCAILTDTPVKNAIEQETRDRLAKKVKLHKIPTDGCENGLSLDKRSKGSTTAAKKRTTDLTKEKKKVSQRRPPQTSNCSEVATTSARKQRSNTRSHNPRPTSSRPPLPRKPVWLHRDKHAGMSVGIM